MIRSHLSTSPQQQINRRQKEEEIGAVKKIFTSNKYSIEGLYQTLVLLYGSQAGSWARACYMYIHVWVIWSPSILYNSDKWNFTQVFRRIDEASSGSQTLTQHCGTFTSFLHCFNTLSPGLLHPTLPCLTSCPSKVVLCVRCILEPWQSMTTVCQASLHHNPGCCAPTFTHQRRQHWCTQPASMIVWPASPPPSSVLRLFTRPTPQWHQQ